MSNQPQAKKHNSALLEELMAEITPLEMAQTQAKMELAARIEDLIKARGWNKKQLAAAVGKQPSEVTKWCSGTQNLTIDVLTQIAYALGVELASLFDKSQHAVSTKQVLSINAPAVQPVILISTPLGKNQAVSKGYVHLMNTTSLVIQTNYQA